MEQFRRCFKKILRFRRPVKFKNLLRRNVTRFFDALNQSNY